MTYDTLKQQRLKWLLGAEAEYAGFCGAAIFPAPLKYSADDYAQQRYTEGFRDGKAALAQEQQTV